MRADIHPKYHEARVHCVCGNEFTVGSTTDGMVHSSTGRNDGRPYFASSYARSM